MRKPCAVHKDWDHFQLVIAWVAISECFDGKRWVAEPPEPRAVMWLRYACSHDIPLAIRYAEENGIARRPGATYYVLPTSERDPLGVARARVLGEWREEGGSHA